ncbi:MAG: hypothetical protein IH958_02985, partial [Chloroflexi bacterium]|nr:hypothetical protein [Chloroflexota bacterium]
NPAAGYTSNWNNKAATADDGRGFGRQQRVIFILERLAADSTWTRDEQRQLNEDLAGLEGKGAFGRYLIPRLREAVDGVGNGGNPAVDTVLAALETHIASPFFGRGFTDPVNDTTIAGEVTFLNSLISQLSSAIYGDEFSGTGLGTPGLDQIQHAIDSAAGGPLGAYSQKYTGDYFNAVDWRIVVRDALSTTATNLGGIPADIARPNSTYVHPLAALFPNLVFDPTPIGNRGIWEEIIEVGPTVLGEFIFPLGQSGFIDEFGMPDRHADSLHQFWANWRFVPMLHVAEDLATDPDGDVDNDGVLDGFEKYYFGSTSPAPTDDADGDGLDLLGEYKAGLDPTNADTLANGITDDVEDLDQDGCTNLQEVSAIELLGGQRDPLVYWDLFDTNFDGAVAFADFLLVLQHFNTNDANGTAAISRSSDPITTADPGPGVYHPRFDRGGQAPGGDPWDELPPDGAIGFADFLSLLRQFGHTCA